MTLTANDAPDPWGGSTGMKVTMPATFGGSGCNYRGLLETISPGLVNGQQYTLEFWACNWSSATTCGGSGNASLVVLAGNTTCIGCSIQVLPNLSNGLPCLTNASNNCPVHYQLTFTFKTSASTLAFYSNTAGSVNFAIYGLNVKNSSTQGYVSTYGTALTGFGCIAAGQLCSVPANSGTATLVSGTVTVSTTAACAPGTGCSYTLINCGKNSSTAIGTLSLGTVTAGTSMVINSLTSTATVATGDDSTVCWRIN